MFEVGITVKNYSAQLEGYKKKKVADSEITNVIG